MHPKQLKSTNSESNNIYITACDTCTHIHTLAYAHTSKPSQWPSCEMRCSRAVKCARVMRPMATCVHMTDDARAGFHGSSLMR
eukprot:1160893-Pelagomonas_calceolata.AAC.6